MTLTPQDGSSPRVWGTLGTTVILAESCRFIPACVGNSHNLDNYHVSTPVHPRVCGELVLPELQAALEAGSSPRVWGTPFSSFQLAYQHRFIPACVGNSPPAPVPRPALAVHPRVWGTRPEFAPTLYRSRFIPACVGNSP